jgi:hypothetical protein
MTVHDVEQRSGEWAALRAGRLCASRAADMLATIQKGEAAGRRNLRVQLVLERITGRSHDRDIQTPAILDGIEREAEALAAYETVTGDLVRKVGFISHDTLLAGGSPDGVIGDFVGLVEAKCCIPATHLDSLKTGTVPGEYLKQITHLLWLTGAQWCDWLSWQPDFPEALQVKLVRVARSEPAIAEYDAKVKTFLAEVDAEVQAVQTLANVGAQLRAAVAHVA